MTDIQIQNSDNLYQIQCRDCNEIIILLEIKDEKFFLQDYLCDFCAKIDNENRLAELNSI